MWKSNVVLASWFSTPCAGFPILPERSHAPLCASVLVLLGHGLSFSPFLRTRCWVLDSGLAQGPLCSLRQNLNPTRDSSGRLKHPNPKRRFVLRSVGSLKPNMPRFRFRRPSLRSFFPVFSSTWCSALCSKENGCKNCLWLASRRIGFWCQHI